MAKRTCSIPGCEAPHKGRGLCHKHRERLRRHGDPLADHRPRRKPCSIEDCDELASSRGWCNKHYARWLAHGDPLVRLPMGPKPGTMRTPPEPRFWAKVDKMPMCWLWTAGTAGEGYGTFNPEPGRHVYAHRYAWELLVGPIPDGYEIDHVKANGCTSRLCVKAIADEHGPAHLEPVTPLENHRRVAAARTHCPKGHPLDGVNAQGRYCLTCNRARAAAVRARRRKESA